jgi:ribose transport system ATP-binding protein
VTILRNGHEVRSFVPSEASDEEVVRMMIGRSTKEEYATDLRHGTGGGPPVLVVEKLASQPHFRDVSFNLAQGEIVGVAGLQDQGQRELFMCLAGALRATHGRIHLGQGPVRFGSPRDAMRAGIGLVPEDRAAEGLMLNMGIRPNVSLASLERLATFGFINRRREQLEVARVLASVNVTPAKMDDEVSSLSGGNQQKVAIAKWLLRGPQVLLLYDPTRGVDVGTKAEIFALMHTIAAQKRGLLFYSTDMEELMNVCNRILVFYRGSIVKDLSGPERTKEAVLSAMLGSPGQQMEVA